MTERALRFKWFFRLYFGSIIVFAIVTYGIKLLLKLL
jgi:hypothetical protein